MVNRARTLTAHLMTLIDGTAYLPDAVILRRFKNSLTGGAPDAMWWSC